MWLYCILRYLTSVEFADALMTTAGGGGNINRLDTFVAAQPPAFGDIRKKCAMACEVSLVGS